MEDVVIYYNHFWYALQRKSGNPASMANPARKIIRNIPQAFLQYKNYHPLPLRDSISRPLTPQAREIPLDQGKTCLL
jgi:hypothetical protein